MRACDFAEHYYAQFILFGLAIQAVHFRRMLLYFLSKSKDAAQRILLFAPQVRRNKRKLNSILSCGSGHPQLEQDGDRARVVFPAWDLPRQLKGE